MGMRPRRCAQARVCPSAKASRYRVASPRAGPRLRRTRAHLASVCASSETHFANFVHPNARSIFRYKCHEQRSTTLACFPKWNGPGISGARAYRCFFRSRHWYQHGIHGVQHTRLISSDSASFWNAWSDLASVVNHCPGLHAEFVTLLWWWSIGVILILLENHAMIALPMNSALPLSSPVSCAADKA